MAGFLPKNKIVDSNSAENRTINDVIGNKEDHSFSNVIGSTSSPSVIGHLTSAYYHIHSSGRLYPELADAVEITNDDGGSPAGAWAEGSKQTVIGSSQITSAFDIHWIKIFTIADNDEYVLKLYNGDTFIGEVGFAKVNNFISHIDANIQIPPQPANSAITATLAAKGGVAARDITIKVFYHTYPDIT